MLPSNGGNCEGEISWTDFSAYYRQIAVLIPEDAYFEEFIEGQYKEKFAASADKLNKEHVMHLLALMRQRLITLAGSSQEEYALRNMFRSFDVDNSGTITMDELGGLISKLGVSCLDGELEAMFRELDSNQNGTLEFEEFQALMISDPYTKYNLIKE